MPITTNRHAGANPNHFAIATAETDRSREIVPLSHCDVNHLYGASISLEFQLIRTLAPLHAQTTSTSAWWAPLARHDKVAANKMRRAFSLAGMEAGLPPALLETMFKVKADAYHLGESCVKRGVTKGLCDLCYHLLGRKVKESLEHVLCNCPFSQAVTVPALSPVIAKLSTGGQTEATTTAAFIKKHKRLLIFGCADPEHSRSQPGPHRAAVCFAAATCHCLIQRRNCNASERTLPLQHRSTDPVRGEVVTPFQVLPKASLKLNAPVSLFAHGESRKVKVTVKNLGPSITGTLRLKAPQSWEVTPSSVPVKLQGKGNEVDYYFNVKAPQKSTVGLLKPSLVSDGQSINFSLQEISYDHIPKQYLVSPASAKIVALNLKMDM